MKKRAFFSVMTLALGLSLFSQGKFLCNEGHITFFSHTALEDITAENKEVASVIDSESGEVAVIVKITAFQFEKKLMQEHFNENYMESEHYPKATFMGKITNNGEIDYENPGSYTVQVEGDMTIHGVVQKISESADMEVGGDGLVVRMKFMLDPSDYDIKIPKVVRKNIAERLEVSISLKHAPI
jgi:hypothetical protein